MARLIATSKLFKITYPMSKGYYYSTAEKEMIFTLRKITNSQISLCKEALEKNNWHLEISKQWLMENLMNKSQKYKDRDANMTTASILHDSIRRMFVLLKVCCESEAASRSDELKTFLSDILKNEHKKYFNSTSNGEYLPDYDLYKNNLQLISGKFKEKIEIKDIILNKYSDNSFLSYYVQGKYLSETISNPNESLQIGRQIFLANIKPVEPFNNVLNNYSDIAKNTAITLALHSVDNHTNIDELLSKTMHNDEKVQLRNYLQNNKISMEKFYVLK